MIRRRQLIDTGEAERELRPAGIGIASLQKLNYGIRSVRCRFGNLRYSRFVPPCGMRYIVAVLLPSCVAAADLTIGVLLPSDPVEAASMRRGIELAAAQTCTSNQIRVIMRERGSQWGADGQEAAEMALDDNVNAIIAPADGAATHLALQVAGRTGVPVVSLCPDDSVIGAGIPWSLRIAPGTTEQALTLFTNTQARRWCAAVDETRAGRESARDLRAAAKLAGRDLSVLAAGDLTNAEPADISNRADALLVWLDETRRAQAVIQHVRRLGFSGLIAVPCSFRERLNGVISASPAVDPNAHAQFHAMFVRRYGVRVRPDYPAALAFDAVTVLRDVLGDTNSFQASVMRLNRAGASGRLIFDRQGRRVTPLRVNPHSP